ncbi:thioredoxin-dependent thiol peroxidase [Arthrobacter sp. H20]|uniref:thioredoxin-dependent thiol peroxidase n=1 Tax=Arthrobacter sp. H20 TaxID=1267981 RepID=UPI00047D66F7|nr:thioredoxin-dependent thiol peroxidase [Arthrobacter sp. H20]
MTERLVSGDTPPDFTLPAADGATVSLKDYAGTSVVVYFYPAASTPGCTTEACDFRDNLSSLAAAGYAILGVSPDAVPKLKKFSDAQDLSFPLLSDEDHSVAEAWGAWGEKKNYGKVYEGLIRSTVVVGPDGLVELAQYNVRATGHVAKLRKDLGAQ